MTEYETKQIWRLWASAMWCHVVYYLIKNVSVVWRRVFCYVITNVSEELNFSNFSVRCTGKQCTYVGTWARRHWKECRLLFCWSYVLFTAVFRRYVASPLPGTFYWYYYWVGVRDISCINTLSFVYVSSIPLLFPWRWTRQLHTKFNVLLSVHHAMYLGNCPIWRTNSFQLETLLPTLLNI